MGVSTAADAEAAFAGFVADVRPRLERAFTLLRGGEGGQEATAEAFAWAWEHWDQVQEMANPAGYLYRVGQSRTRPRRQRVLFDRRYAEEPLVEPGLPDALAALSPKQRVAVVLVHGFGMTLREVAEVTGLGVTTVQTHMERGLRRLRKALGTDDV